jgi:hypothetical protein
MKKIIGYTGSYLFFYLGCLAASLMYIAPGIWNLYQKLMIKSIKIQDWAGLDKPWDKK